MLKICDSEAWGQTKWLMNKAFVICEWTSHSSPHSIGTTSVDISTVILPLLPVYTPCSHDEINSIFPSINKSVRDAEMYSPLWNSTQSNARLSTTQSFMVRGATAVQSWRDHAGLVKGSVWKEVRLGVWLELCRLQLPCLDFQLHPRHRLRGKRKITPESVYFPSSDPRSRNMYSGAPCWVWLQIA